MKHGVFGYVVLIGLIVLALFSLGRAIHFNFFTSVGGADFHAYWRAGLFVRQKVDPYAAYLSRQEPKTPISYLGGYVEEKLQRSRGMATAPTNTAPIVLLLSLFSWLPWPMAKLLWFLINCVLVLIAPWLVLRLLSLSQYLPRLVLLLICFTFYALKSTRAALGTGQTTLLVFTLMVLYLLAWSQHWVIAGVMLGVALSKYSVALPVFLYALYKRQFKVVAVSIFIQIVGILTISAFSGSSPLSIVQSYYQIMQAHKDNPGIHLAELFEQGSQLRVIAPVVLTLFVMGFLVWVLRKEPGSIQPPVQHQFHDLHLLTVLSLWALLVAYHRPYDGVLVILFVVLIVHGVNWPANWRLSQPQQRGLILFLVFSVAMLIVPYEQIGSLLPGDFIDSLLDIIAKGVVITLVAMLIASLYLLRRVHSINYSKERL